MAVFSSVRIREGLKAIDQPDCLADAFIAFHGGTSAAARWLSEETGRAYTRRQVNAFRRRGVPEDVRFYAIACVMITVMPGDSRLAQELAAILAA